MDTTPIFPTKQLLKPNIVELLLENGIKPVLVEYLGWKNGTANAINNSANPYKAALTCLSSEKGEKMRDAFFAKKKSLRVLREKPDISKANRQAREYEQFEEAYKPLYSEDEVNEYDPKSED
jgi:hypothetical protein